MSGQRISQHRGSNTSKFPTVFVTSEDDTTALRTHKLNSESVLLINDHRSGKGGPTKLSDVPIDE